MRINRVELCNIGPYKGVHSINLETNQTKNIILIGGKNGSGKTSFLKAIKIGLFGSFSFGFKTDSASYFNQIKEIINSTNEKQKAFIELNFNWNHNQIENNILLTRTWINKNKEYVEYLEIELNGKQLNEYEKVEFNERFRSVYTPQIVDSIIYDGEKIGNSIDSSKISEYIEGVFSALFGVSMLNQLNVDLNSYMEHQVKKDSSEEEIIGLSLVTDINNLKNRKKETESELGLLTSKKNSLLADNKGLSKTFHALGGLSKNEKKQIRKQLIRIEKEKESKSKTFKSFIENEAVFAMNTKLIQKAITHIGYELPLKYSQQIDEISEYVKDFDMSEIKKELLLLSRNKAIIHGLSKNDLEYIKRRKKEISKINRQALLIMDNKEFISEEYNIVRSKLSLSEDHSTLDSIMLKKNANDNALYKLENDIVLKQNILSDINSRLEINLFNYESVNERMKKKNSKVNSFVLSHQATKINNKFIEYITNKKFEQISFLALNVFVKSIRKKDSFKTIKIDTKFTVHLYDGSNKEININVLSAGEKQLLISSIIWAIFKVSKKDDIFIFDTPLARLDSNNRLNFIDNIIKTMGKQSIVLSTDSEFVDEYYDLIKPNVCQVYRIDFNEKDKSSKIVQGYFNEVGL